MKSGKKGSNNYKLRIANRDYPLTRSAATLRDELSEGAAVEKADLSASQPQHGKRNCVPSDNSLANYKSASKAKNKRTSPQNAPAVNSSFTISHSSLFRVIDANLNRCREGLRVVEDCLRYVLNDGTLYKKARRVRHNTDKILRGSYALLIKKRDSVKDSGREMPETSKKDLPSVIIANFKRAQESLRALEEFSKTFEPSAAGQFKKQRYAAYNLEKAVFLKFSIKKRNEKNRRPLRKRMK